MSRPLASLIGALVASTTLACAGSALAGELSAAALGSGYTAVDAPLGAPTELSVDLRGRVASRCDLAAPLTGLDGMDMNRGGAVQGVFAIDCNTPYVLRVRSQRGGFATDVALEGVEALAPYQLAVQVGTDLGRQDLGWCDAAALTADASGACIFAADTAEGGWSSGEAVSIDETGSIRLRWDAPAGDQARLGAYNDVIIIELEVRS